MSTNSSIPPCRQAHSCLLMWWPCTCIAAHLRPCPACEDKEQEPDRWCSHSAWGQEFWLILAQWLWNLRLELGHALRPTPMRTTEFAPATSPEAVAKSGSAIQTT